MCFGVARTDPTMAPQISEGHGAESSAFVSSSAAPVAVTPVLLKSVESIMFTGATARKSTHIFLSQTTTVGYQLATSSCNDTPRAS